MRKTFFSVVAALAIIGSAAPASAEMVTIDVSAADLDLSVDSDVDLLRQRVASAARQACSRSSAYSVAYSVATRACREELTEKAELRITQMRAAAISLAETRELAVR